MNQEKAIKLGIAGVVVVLASLVYFKPRIDNEFHKIYVNNLNQMDSLSGTVVRDHLMVTRGLVKHYDHLEASLMKMERAARLATITPDHVGDIFAADALRLSEDYLQELSSIRADVELSKRGIGLLANSRAALSVSGHRVNEELYRYSSSNAASTGALAVGLHLVEAMAEEASLRRVSSLLDELAQFSVIDAGTLAQIRLHTEIVENFAEPLEKASRSIYEKASGLTQAGEIRERYLEHHEQVQAVTTWQLWISYTLTAILVGLVLLLSAVSSKARKEAEKAMSQAESAREDSEQHITNIKEAVTHINQLLEKISAGDFSQRISMSFTDELNALKDGVNSAADSVELTMQELQRVMVSMREGNFTTQIDERVTGEFRDEVERTNQSLDHTLNSIGDVMEDMRNGIFSSQLTIEAQGSFDTLKSAVNDSMQSLNDSFKELRRIVEKQAEGDFTQRVDRDWPGDLGSLGHSLNATSNKVNDMVSSILDLSDQVASASQSVLNNSQRLKDQSDVQANSIDAAMQSARHVSSLIDVNRQSTESAAGLAAKSQSDALNCQQLSGQAKDAMKYITSKTAEISAITATIETIASKTNLLSLNASVEAVRANEHGKGFSVVAGEVKALARMSAQASASIGLLIQDTDKQVKFGSDSVMSTASALNLIGESIEDVCGISRTMTESLHEQSSEMNLMAEKVNSAFELARTNQELANQTHDTSAALDALASKMASQVAFFKVRNDSGKNADVTDSGQILRKAA